MEVTDEQGARDGRVVCEHDKPEVTSYHPDTGCEKRTSVRLACGVLKCTDEIASGAAGVYKGQQNGDPVDPPDCTNTNNNWLALPPDEGCEDTSPVCVDGNGMEVA